MDAVNANRAQDVWGILAVASEATLVGSNELGMAIEKYLHETPERLVWLARNRDSLDWEKLGGICGHVNVAAGVVLHSEEALAKLAPGSRQDLEALRQMFVERFPKR